MSAPSFNELIDGAADVLETTADYVRVIRDPVYSTDDVEYARMLKGTDGVIDGWLVMAGTEEEDIERGVDGADQTVYLSFVAMTTANRDRSPSGSLTYFGGKIAQAKDAFRLQANKNLGITTSGVTVRQHGLFAPEGYLTVALTSEEVIHLASMRMRVFVSVC